MALLYKSIPRRLSDGSTRVYHYHRVTGRRVDGEPGTKGWDAAIAAAGVPDAKAGIHGTVGWLIDQFRCSPRFAALAGNSQRIYERGWRALAPVAGQAAGDVKPRHIHTIYDSLLPKVGLANQFRTAASVLFDLGLRRGVVEVNPVVAIERESGGHLPDWSAGMIEAFRQREGEAKLHGRLAFHIGIYTGMREGDLCRLTWAQYDGQHIRYVPAKTARKVGLELRIPVHPDLKAVLDEAQAQAQCRYVIHNPGGDRMTDGGFRQMWKRTLQALDIPHVAYHGSRKAAVIMLAHCGCTVHEIMSWTGHSMGMVTLYTRGVSQERLSDAAYEKLVRRREDAHGAVR